jgi:RimJ/RimL family protein N-acetyltransferase
MENSNWLFETELVGKYITLTPLKKSHRDALVSAASDGNLWELWFTSVPSEQTVDASIKFALSEQSLGRSLPFVVIDNKTGNIIGSTRFCNAVSTQRRVEIGYTWYSKSYQRSFVNAECKFLMLSHAFEKLNAIAVEFRTNWFNHASRSAISKLGAKQDGVLRNHSLDAEGIYRDTVVFSIIDNEWSTVKRALLYRLTKI